MQTQNSCNKKLLYRKHFAALLASSEHTNWHQFVFWLTLGNIYDCVIQRSSQRFGCNFSQCHCTSIQKSKHLWRKENKKHLFFWQGWPPFGPWLSTKCPSLKKRFLRGLLMVPMKIFWIQSVSLSAVCSLCVYRHRQRNTLNISNISI